MSRVRHELNLCEACKAIFQDDRKLPNGRSIQEQIFCIEAGYEYQRTREEITAAVTESNCTFCLSIETHITGQRDARDGITNSRSLKKEALWCPPNTKVRLQLKYQQEVGRLMLYHVTSSCSRSCEQDVVESLLSSWEVRVENGEFYSTWNMFHY
jgi:hypothetical protein